MIRLTILLLLCASTSWAIPAVEAYKTFTREKLTADDLNASFTRNRNAINVLNALYDTGAATHSTTKTKTDSLDANAAAAIYVLAPLTSYSVNDSLDYHRANIDHLYPDTLQLGDVMTSLSAGGSYAFGKTSIQPGATLHIKGSSTPNVYRVGGDPSRPLSILRLEGDVAETDQSNYLDFYHSGDSGWSIQPVDTSAAYSTVKLSIGPDGLGNLYVGKNDGLAGTTTIYQKLAVTRKIDGPIATFTNPQTTSVAGGRSPGGILVDFSTAPTGSTARYFFQGEDATQVEAVIYSTGDMYNINGTYGTLSDEAVKADIANAPSQLDSLKRVKVREYSLKADRSGKKHMGVVAQEIALVFPEMVEEVTWGDSTVWVKSDTGMVATSVPVKRYAVKTSQMTWRLVAAVQELDKRVDNLELMVESMAILIILLGSLLGVKIKKVNGKLLEMPPDPPVDIR